MIQKTTCRICGRPHAPLADWPEETLCDRCNGFLAVAKGEDMETGSRKPQDGDHIVASVQAGVRRIYCGHFHHTYTAAKSCAERMKERVSQELARRA